MSDDGQIAATSINADLMGEVMQGSAPTEEAAARQDSLGDASMLAQVGNTPLTAENSQESTQPLSEPQAAATETPNLKPAAVDTKASPIKPSADGATNIADTGPAQAKQDLNDKLDDAAPDTQQPVQDGLEPAAQADLTTVVVPADTTGSATSSVQTNGHPDSTVQTQNGDAHKSSDANGTADSEPVSVKNLIKRRSSSAESNGQDSSKQHSPPVRRKTEDELPEGIRALKSRFSGVPSNGSPSSPKAVPLPSSNMNKVPPSVIHLEVEHKPGTKFWPYKELKELRIENGIDPTCKEEYLTEEDFSQVFKKWDLNRAQFKAQPVWRQRMQKQTVGLF